MNIGIPLSVNAYTPEAYAYENYLKKLGHQVQLEYKLNNDNDINIYFMGTRPFWKKCNDRAKEIHEYHSLSTYPYPYLKNLIKKNINKKPHGRIFLNKNINESLCFKDSVPHIYRDMGVDEILFQKPNLQPDYDIVYCGSISGRVGLIEVILKLSKIYKIIVVGRLKETERVLLQVKNITIVGAVNRAQLPDIYKKARFGLNYTPNIYPYNIQTSTKTLEYLASGLGVISNRYQWAEDFFKHINYQPLWLNANDPVNNIKLEKLKSVDRSIMNKYSWESILSTSNLDGFLKEVLDEVN